jgi:hypothetical protein
VDKFVLEICGAETQSDFNEIPMMRGPTCDVSLCLAGDVFMENKVPQVASDFVDRRDI